MITSLRNPKIARAVKLKKRAFRNEERAFLVEGAQAIAEALSPVRLDELFVTDAGSPIASRAGDAGVPVQTVTDEVMSRLTDTVTSQGLVAVASFLDVGLEDLPAEASCIAVICAGRDPGNAGAVLRSADAGGADGVIFTAESVDVYNPKTVRASAGSVFHVPVVRGVDLAEAVAAARSRGLTVYAMDAAGDEDLYEQDLSRPSAFIFGNEAWGLPDEAKAMADHTIRVPISTRAESLNLAAAAGVCLFEAARQRRGGEFHIVHAPSEGLETLIAASAHDLRSPITGIRSLAMTLQERGGSLSEEQRGMMIDAVVHESERVDLLIRQLVDAARVAAGRLDHHAEDFDVADVVRELIEFTAVDPDHPKIVWEGRPMRVFADRLRLRQALGSFVEAEIWFAQEGPIRIGAKTVAGMLVVEVARRAPSVTQAEAEELFLPRQPGAGSGSKIGLYVTRAVAEAQGGSARVDVGEDLRLILELPV